MLHNAMFVGETSNQNVNRPASPAGPSEFSLGSKGAAAEAPMAVGHITQTPSPSGGSVRFNIFELGMAPPLPQDLFSRAVRATADGIGSLVGTVFDIPEGTQASRQAPMLVHALRQRGIEVSPEGDIALPNTPEGGAMFADLVVLSHAPGDLALYPGLHGLRRFRDPGILENAGFSDAFITGFLDKADGHARSAGMSSILAFWGIAGGAASARNNSPYHELTRRVLQREAAQQSRPLPPAEEPSIPLRRGSDGVYRSDTHPAHGAPDPGSSAQSEAIMRPNHGGPVVRHNDGGANVAPGGLVTGANPSLAGGAGRPGLSATSPQDAGAVYGPTDPAGIAGWRAEVEQAGRHLTQALDDASRANPVPALPGVRPPDIGPYNWDQVGGVAREFNARSTPLEVAIRIPVDRDYAGLGSRREVGLLIGSPFALADQVDAMKRSGQVPREFDLAGAAGQVDVDWNAAIRAEADIRANGIAARYPVALAGNRTFVQPDRSAALQVAQQLNRIASGAAPVAVPVAINREIVSGSVSAVGISHEVWVGSPDQLRNFHDTMSRQGRLAGDPSVSDLARDAGIEGSFPGRVAAAQDLRAAQAEIAHPTTLFGSTVGVQPDAGAAQREVLAFNRDPAPPEHLRLYVPLTRELAGEGLSPGARGTAHTLYQGPAGNLRGFYDEMTRQGRIPEGVSFDMLLRQSGIENTYHARIAQREAAIAAEQEALRDAPANRQQPPLVPPAQSSPPHAAGTVQANIQEEVQEQVERYRALPRIPGESEQDRRRRFLETIDDPALRSFVEAALKEPGEGMIGGPTGTSRPATSGAGNGVPPDVDANTAADADEPDGREGGEDTSQNTSQNTSQDTAQQGAVSPFLSGRSLFNPDPQAMAQAMEAWSARAAEGIAAGEPLGAILDDIGASAHELGPRLYPGTPVADDYGVARDSGARTTDLTHRLFADALAPTLDFITRDWANVVDRRTGAAPSFPPSQLRERLAAGDPEALSLSHLSRMQTADGEAITARVDITPNEGADGDGHRVTTVYPSDPAQIEAIREALSERWAQMAGIPPGDPRAVEAAAHFYYDYIRLYWHVHGNDEIGTSLVSGYLEEKGFPVSGINQSNGPAAGAFQNDRETFIRRFAEGEYLRFPAPPAASPAAPSGPQGDLAQVLREAQGGDAILEALASAPPEALRDPDLIRQALHALNESGEFVYRVDTRTYEEIEADGGFRVRDASDPAGGFVYAATDLYAGGGHAHSGGTLYVIRRPPEEQRLGPDVFDFRAESDAWYNDVMEGGEPVNLQENPLFDTDRLTPAQRRGLREHVDNDQIRFARDIPLDEIVFTIMLGRDGRIPVEATPRATDRP